jgi:hypothetical protein
MHPYIAGEYHIKHERHRLAARAERHRLLAASRDTARRVRSPKRLLGIRFLLNFRLVQLNRRTV